jgi:hypothetical protein
MRRLDPRGSEVRVAEPFNEWIFRLFPVFEQLSWSTSINAKWLELSAHNRPCSDYDAIADDGTIQNNHMRANPHIVTYRNAQLMVSLSGYGSISRIEDMIGWHDYGMCCDPNVRSAMRGVFILRASLVRSSARNSFHSVRITTTSAPWAA